MNTTRVELVALLRGMFAGPAVAVLADLGAATRMRAGPFAPADLAAGNPAALAAVLDYLARLGLVEPAPDGRRRLTPAGEYVFDRTGAFHLLRSYRGYFDRLPDLLADPAAVAAVRRLENVAGTGQLHARKFFPAALDRLAARGVRCVVDVGCGNGEFLAAALDRFPDAGAVGVDLSAEAAAATVERFRATPHAGRVTTITADATDVAAWGDAIPGDGTGAVVAVWFVLHEFAGGAAGPVVRFLRELHARRPRAAVLIGEIVVPPAAAVAAVHAESVVPEVLLFHALSGQGPLTWEEHHAWLAAVPYRLAAEDRYDDIPTPTGPVPSTFVWHLDPTG